MAGIIHSIYPLCTSIQEKETIQPIGDWYITLKGIFFRIYGATKPPHLFPKFVPNILDLMEIIYHTYVHRFLTLLINNKIHPFPITPIKVRSYQFTNHKHATVEWEALKAFHFGEMCYQKHDLKRVIENQVYNLPIICPCAHWSNLQEEV